MNTKKFGCSVIFHENSDPIVTYLLVGSPDGIFRSDIEIP